MSSAVNTRSEPGRILPFDLYRIDDFVQREHPIFHPVYELEEYAEYWKSHVDKCIQGVWGLDRDEETGQGGYRFAPGNLYFYVSDTIIKVGADEGREVEAPPDLRDIEWLIFYALTECDGFSGFADDHEYSAFRVLGKMQGKIFDSKGKKITKLTNQDKILLEKYESVLKKPNGEYKTYKDPKELLYATYDKPLGVPQYYNEMRNLVVLSSRGIGKSYSISNGVILYDFIFGSARTSDEFFARKNPAEIVVGSFDSKKSDSLLSKTKDAMEYLRRNVGAHEETNTNSPLYQPTTGSWACGFSITNRILQEGGQGYIGTGSKIHHVTYKDNAQAGVGYRARRMVVEEAGLLSNFLAVHGENMGSQKRDLKSGYTVYIGTGGDIKKIKGIREAFYKPSAYDCVEFNNNFSKKKGKIGLFIPCYFRSSLYKTKQGNTRIKEAYDDEMTLRESFTSNAFLEKHKISYPINPSEMFMQTEGNAFPTKRLEKRLEILEGGLWEEIAKPGVLNYNTRDKTSVVFTPKSLSESSIIKRFDDEKEMSDEEITGTIVIYEHPVENRPELSHYNYLYLVTYDPVQDEDGGTSLACVHVWKFWWFEDRDSVQFNMVAEWLGRHIGENGLDKDHEMAFKLACYYDAPIFPEVNLKDVIRHARMTNRYYFFLPKPGLALGEMEIKQKKSYPVGMKISPGMKPDLEKYLNDALHVTVDTVDMIRGSEETHEDIYMVDCIPSMRWCEELIYYNRDDNFDSMSSSFLFGVISRERKLRPIRTEDDEKSISDEDDYLNYLRKSEIQKNSQQISAFNY